jgi:outer membrane protein OmpA-like peptidoglycan-associated protein
MRITRLLLLAGMAVLTSAGAISAQASGHSPPGVFYDPSNPASPTGKTIGYELYRTIGCPGRQLLDTPCPVPAEPVAAATEPASTAPAASEPAALAPAATTEPAAVAPVATTQPSAPAHPVLQGVNFDFDRATLRPEAYAILDQAADTLRQWGDGKVEVAGHTDYIGTEAYNMGLSLRRAEAVANYLITKGIPGERLSIKGYGESRPVADNTTAAGRFQNRRVELVPLR